MTKRPSVDECSKAYTEAKARDDKPIVVNCLGTDKYEIIGKRTYATAKIWSDKQDRWDIHDVLEYEDVCPICMKLILVRAIPNTTWLACCSKKCYDDYRLWREETFGKV